MGLEGYLYMQELARLGGRASAQARGDHSWFQEYPLEDNSPLRYAFTLAQDPAYHFEGRRQRRIHAQKIADALTTRFSEHYTARQVVSIFNLYKEEREHFDRAQGKAFTPKPRIPQTRSRARIKQLRRQGFYSWKESTPDGDTYLDHLFILATDEKYQRGERLKARDIAHTLKDLYGINCNADSVTDAIRRYKTEFEEWRNNFKQSA